MDESTATVLSVPDMKGTIQFSALMYILTFMFIILRIHHIHVINRHPAGSWYGKLDILWFMKRGVVIFHFYSWALNPTVNAFKTDSALLDSWIKWCPHHEAADGGQWWKLDPPGFLFPQRFRVWCHCSDQDNISETPVCYMTFHRLVTIAETPLSSSSSHTKRSMNVWLKSCDASPKCCRPLGSCNIVLPLNGLFCVVVCFPCALFSTHTWPCLTPGEFHLLG